MSAPSHDHALAAYEVFAAFYDEFTERHDDRAWAEALERLALDAGLGGTRLLDVACGTGRSFVPMLERGYEVTACDLSPAMIAVAAAKGGGARLEVHDMRALPVLGSFDLVWCLGDALNYLHGDAELAAALEGMRSNLAPSGVLVFDVNTLGTFRRVYSSLFVKPGEQQVLVLDGHGADDDGRARVWIDRLTAEEEGRWLRDRSEHHHFHHADVSIRTELARAGLAVASVHGSRPTGELEAPLDELDHTKAVYIARKERR